MICFRNIVKSTSDECVGACLCLDSVMVSFFNSWESGSLRSRLIGASYLMRIPRITVLWAYHKIPGSQSGWSFSWK